MRHKRGFTLIEVLIALAIFAILATITSTVLFNSLNMRKRINVQTKRLEALQLTVTLMQRDIAQFANRAIRTDNMQLIPSFVGNTDSIELTRGGNINPNSQEKRSTLKRIAYVCRNQQLIRRSWSALDPVNYPKAQEKTLLSGLKKCQFSYLNATLQTLPNWLANTQDRDNKTQVLLPHLIQFHLLLANNANFDYLFILPEGLYAENG